MIQTILPTQATSLSMQSKWQGVKRFFKRLAFKTRQDDHIDAISLSRLGPVTVVIPALNEARRIAEVVQYALSDPITGEVIVMDDSSIDDTARLASEAGATVLTSSMLGKGASMHDGVLAAKYDIIVYLDGDLTGLRPNIISDLAQPILMGEADFVKAQFGRNSGRVTELTAKPMLKLFFPELSKFSQPLGGIIAAKKALLQQINFEDDYGVDIGLLIDAHLAGAKLTQVEVGSLEHDSQSLQGLSLMAQEVSRVILERAKLTGRLSVEQIMSVFELERQNRTDIDRVLAKLQNCTKLVLLDMDGTVTTSRYILDLAKETGLTAQLAPLLGNEDMDAATRSQEIAALFRFVHKSKFEKVACETTIRPDIIEAVNTLRRQGYRVGVISDSYFIAAEIIRRRIFADFALAHNMVFDAGVCQGKMLINRAFFRADGCQLHECCKSNVLRYITDQEAALKKDGVIAVGDNLNDLCLLRQAHQAYTIEPKHPSLKEEGIIEISSFDELMKLINLKAENLKTENTEAS